MRPWTKRPASVSSRSTPPRSRNSRTALPPELIEELDRLSLPFTDDSVPSEAELRIAQAQLVGWLEGLFHGIRTALFAQQMAARAQLEQMRRQAIEGSENPAPMPRPQSGPYL